MKELSIKRNIEGVELTIHLQPKEIEAIYRAAEKNYRAIDIQSKLIEMVCDEEGIENDGDMPEKSDATTEYSEVLRGMYNSPEDYYDSVENTLSNNDSYWDSFWMSIEYTLKDKAEAEMKFHKENF